jgi:FkbM family methyltransferase
MFSGILANYVKAIGGSQVLAYVGANTGVELPFIKTITNKIYAFEPVTHPVIWQALNSHKDSKTEIIDVALSNFTGEAKFYLANNNFESSSLLAPQFVEKEYPYLNFAEYTTVKTRRFDSFEFANTVDTMVIDVQGAELQVLEGITDYSNIKLIILEYTVAPPEHLLYKGTGTFDQIYRKLFSHGFEFCESYGAAQPPGAINPVTKVVHNNAVFMKFR